MNNSIDTTALFKIEYGLYVVTSNDGVKDNGCIVDAVMQVTSTPARVAVTVNKDNYTHEIIEKTRKFNLNCITKDAPFELFERFGFQSGRSADKFHGLAYSRSQNSLAVLDEYVNSFMSLEVYLAIDLGTHTTFICDVSEAMVLSDKPTITYSHYRSDVKPKPEKNADAPKKKGYVCTICGYVHEGDILPEDFVCPICKQGASVFKEIE